MESLSSLDLLSAGGILLLAYFIRGISGFGSGLVAVPLLALFLPLTFVVPFMLVMDLTASAALGHSNRQQVDWHEIKPLIPGSIIGVVAGATLLLNLDQSALLATLGLFVLAFALRSLLYLHGDAPISKLWAWPASLTGGTVSALFGTGGPPYIIYLSHRLKDKAKLRATFSGLFTMEGGLRVVTFLATGLLLQNGMFTALLAALPIMALGLYLGHRVHLGISSLQMLRLVGLLLVGSGLSLLWKAWT